MGTALVLVQYCTWPHTMMGRTLKWRAGEDNGPHTVLYWWPYKLHCYSYSAIRVLPWYNAGTRAHTIHGWCCFGRPTAQCPCALLLLMQCIAVLCWRFAGTHTASYCHCAGTHVSLPWCAIGCVVLPTQSCTVMSSYSHALALIQYTGPSLVLRWSSYNTVRVLPRTVLVQYKLSLIMVTVVLHRYGTRSHTIGVLTQYC